MAQTQNTPQPQAPKIRVDYVDVPNIHETFADTVHELLFDGQTFRLVLGVTRMDDKPTDGEIVGKRYTACRVVLPAIAAVDLSRKLGRVLAAAMKQGEMRKGELSEKAPGQGKGSKAN